MVFRNLNKRSWKVKWMSTQRAHSLAEVFMRHWCTVIHLQGGSPEAADEFWGTNTEGLMLSSMAAVR